MLESGIGHSQRRLGTCEFSTLLAGSACIHCGWRLPHDYDRPPRRNCPARVILAYQHFGEYLRDQPRKGRGCPRTRGVYACSLLGECVPLLPEVDGIACCETCEQRSAIPEPAAAEDSPE